MLNIKRNLLSAALASALALQASGAYAQSTGDEGQKKADAVDLDTVTVIGWAPRDGGLARTMASSLGSDAPASPSVI